MSLGTLLSRILGFLRDLTIATVFSKTETDIFFVAFRFPNFFRRLLGEGSFSSSVTPALTQSLQKKGKAFTQKSSSCLFTLLFCVSTSLSLLGVVFMDVIMEFLFADSAYAQIENKLHYTIYTGRIVFVYLFFVSLYSYFMSIAHIFGKFFLPALAPAFFNLSLIVFALTPKTWWPFPSVSLAWAVLLGGVLQLIPLVYTMKQIQMLPRFTWSFKQLGLLQVGKRFLPGILGLSGLSFIGLINVYFAARLEEGVPSAIYFADRLMEFPRALIAVSLGTALIPKLTRQYSLNHITELKNTISYYLNLTLFLTLPCALTCLILPDVLVSMIFGRGEFNAESIAQTAIILKFYSVVLLVSSFSRILFSCFFALNKNWYLVFCTTLFICFHAICQTFFTKHYGLQGLAGATALSFVFYFIILTTCLLYLLKDFCLKPVMISLLKNLPGLGLMAICLLAYPHVQHNIFYFLHPSLSQFVTFFTVCFLACSVYVLSGYFFKESQACDIIKWLQKIFKRRV